MKENPQVEQRRNLHRCSVARSAAGLLLALVLWPVKPIEAQTTSTYDFDTGSPTLTVGQNIALDQTSGGINAHFSSPQGAAFSIQNAASTSLTLSTFSGQYLYDNIAPANASQLDISFSKPLTSITLQFATADFNQTEQASLLQLSAFENSTATPVGTPVSVRGVYGSDSMPMGTLTFNSAQPFNFIELEIPAGQVQGTSDFLLDNITAIAAVPEPSALEFEIFGLLGLVCVQRSRHHARNK